MTYYKKVGRKYIPIEHYELEGVPEGLYLVYKGDYFEGRLNALHVTRVHEIKNIGKWADIYNKYNTKLTNTICERIDKWIKEKGQYSIQDLSNTVITVLSEFEDD